MAGLSSIQAPIGWPELNTELLLAAGLAPHLLDPGHLDVVRHLVAEAETGRVHEAGLH